ERKRYLLSSFAARLLGSGYSVRCVLPGYVDKRRHPGLSLQVSHREQASPPEQRLSPSPYWNGFRRQHGGLICAGGAERSLDLNAAGRRPLPARWRLFVEKRLATQRLICVGHSQGVPS